MSDISYTMVHPTHSDGDQVYTAAVKYLTVGGKPLKPVGFDCECGWVDAVVSKGNGTELWTPNFQNCPVYQDLQSRYRFK